MPRSAANRAALSMVPSPPRISITSAFCANWVFCTPPRSFSSAADVLSKMTSIFRSRSQLTTACTVALISGNFGFVNIPMLLLFIDL